MDSDDELCLSDAAKLALAEFYREESEKASVEAENWQLSQFWYSDATANSLALECLSGANGGRIACVSAPSVYRKLKELRPQQSADGQFVLLEFDRKFEHLAGENFHFYDYNSPLELPDQLCNQFNLVLIDPPYLSRECLEKFAETTRFLWRKDIPNGRVIICTGAAMEPLVMELFQAEPVSFQPRHERNLANDFRCYLNYPWQTDLS